MEDASEGGEDDFERAIGHVVEDVAFVGRFAHDRAVSVAEHEGQLLDDDAVGHAVVLGERHASEIEALHRARKRQQGIAVVGLAPIAAVGPRVVHVLPIRRRTALRSDDARVGIDEGTGGARRLFIHQRGIACRHVVVERDDVVLGREGGLGPNDLAPRRGRQQGERHKTEHVVKRGGHRRVVSHRGWQGWRRT